MNPLLDLSGLPRFNAFKPEFVTPAVDELLASSRAVIAQLGALDAPPTWDNFASPLYDALEKLNRAWGQVGHMNGVMNSPELREVYNANLPKVTQFYTEFGQNPQLFERFKRLAASPAAAQLTAAQRAVIEHELRDFRLGGADLPAEKKQRFMAVREKLSALSSRFSDNLLDATNAFAHYVDAEALLAGIPADVLQAAQEAAAADGKTGWKFTLHAPSYLPVMQYADNRGLRETIYRAYSTRAAEFGDPQWDNTRLIGDIVALRRELAVLLGFANYTEYSLEPKMAESPQQVLEFLTDLARRAKPFAERDLAELKAFARDELKLADLKAWDIAYASEKLRIARYAFSDQEVKQYLPETTVLPGMFRVVETLYGISILPDKTTASSEQGSRLRDANVRESGAAPSSAVVASVSGVTSPEGTPVPPSDGVPTWHPDVRFFSIRDAARNLLGQFYLDLYARPSKRGGAWMDDAITRRRTARGIQTPVAYLNCNFAAPVGETAGEKRPALFTHDEVITLFHEFGHGLHHLLTRVDELGVAGINGVEWDAVELPSQFMENFCWEWDALAPLTRHIDTGARLPRTLFDKMLAAKNFQSGLQMVRQIEFSLFDLHLHYDYDPQGGTPAQALLDDIRRQVAVIIPPAFNRFPQSFSHIFAGGYGAGYYSYKWAEVLSADAYSLFEENGVLDTATGRRFRDEILAIGGSRPALESFVAFRGRAPNMDALLRHCGMTAAT